AAPARPARRPRPAALLPRPPGRLSGLPPAAARKRSPWRCQPTAPSQTPAAAARRRESPRTAASGRVVRLGALHKPLPAAPARRQARGGWQWALGVRPVARARWRRAGIEVPRARLDTKASETESTTPREGTQEWLHQKTGEAIHAFRSHDYGRAIDIVDALRLDYQDSELLRAIRRRALAEARNASSELRQARAGDEADEPELAQSVEGTPAWLHEETGEAIYAFRTNDFGSAVAVVDRLLVHGQGNDLLRAIRSEALARARTAGIDLLPAHAAEVAGDSDLEDAQEWLHERTGDAIYAYRTNDYGRAVDVAEQLLARNQGNALVLEVGGFSANRVANWPAAAKFWEVLSGLQKDRRGPRLQHAGALMECGEGAAALDIVETLLA